MNPPVCRRCLLSETDAGTLYQTVQRRIAQIPEGMRTDASEYSRRLACCRACDSLVNGLCGMCGCFAELRAARAEKHCPHPDHFW